MMLETILIFIVGLIPAFVSLIMMRKAEAQAREQLQSAIAASANHRFQSSFTPIMPQEYQYVEGIGYFLGDNTCRFNARSAYLRCAVNPSGPCQECPYYESKEL
ncbi:DUF6464 family protein [Pantanalinema sp. GBBB05]|uniref:DUF6464 family protein n=1 Tax=Pantanalinema sp. GBBB05 TaxID=2604139 RepID=UPI003D8139FB